MAKLGDDLEKHVEESLPFIENLGDLSKLIEQGYFTVAQCALIIPAYLSRDHGYHDEMFEHYYVLACVDIARGDLIARHPKTRLPYSQYLGMMEGGVFGEDGEEMPIPTADWLVSLDDTEKWLHSKGVPVNFDKLRTDLDKQKQPEKSIPQPVANWKMAIQSQAAVIWRQYRAMAANPTKNSIKGDLARWCRDNKITTKTGINPDEDYIYRHVLRGWTPPTD
jgi:hypothetical protein